MEKEYIIYAEAFVGGNKVTLVLGFSNGKTSSEAYEKLKVTREWEELRKTLADGAIKIREVGETDLAFVRLGEIDRGEEGG